ncbi:hypothetical protein BH11BAC7_BH11BAC7_27290 [soil metagenome]
MGHLWDIYGTSIGIYRKGDVGSDSTLKGFAVAFACAQPFEGFNYTTVRNILRKENCLLPPKESCGPLFLFFFSLVEKKQKNRHLTRVCLNSAEKIERKPSRLSAQGPRGLNGFLPHNPTLIFSAEFLTANPLRPALLLNVY